MLMGALEFFRLAQEENLEEQKLSFPSISIFEQAQKVSFVNFLEWIYVFLN